MEDPIEDSEILHSGEGGDVEWSVRHIATLDSQQWRMHFPVESPSCFSLIFRRGRLTKKCRGAKLQVIL